jgi:hypothetical protein
MATSTIMSMVRQRPATLAATMVVSMLAAEVVACSYLSHPCGEQLADKPGIGAFEVKRQKAE